MPNISPSNAFDSTNVTKTYYGKFTGGRTLKLSSHNFTSEKCRGVNLWHAQTLGLHFVVLYSDDVYMITYAITQ